MSKTSLIIIIALLLWPTTSHCHPHVFIDCAVILEFKEGKLSGIAQQWIFDDMFSAMMIMDYDSNANGRFDANEIGPIKSDYFDMFKPLSYFTKIYRHNSVITFDHTNHFTAEINDGRLIYRFRLNTGALDPEDLKIALYDETYYHDVNIISADMQGSPPYRIRARETELAEVSFYFDQLHPACLVLERMQ